MICRCIHESTSGLKQNSVFYAITQVGISDELSKSEVSAGSGPGKVSLGLSDERELGMGSDYRKWDRFHLTYSMWDFNPALSRKGQIEAVRWALDLWQDVTRFRFLRLPDRTEADIELYWTHEAEGDHAWANPPPGSAGQRREDGNCWFNLARNWTLDFREDDEQPLDFLTLCAHELGHAIGIGHYCRFGAGLMTAPYRGSVRDLGSTDVGCYRQLYEPKHEPDSCCVYFGNDLSKSTSGM